MCDDTSASISFTYDPMLTVQESRVEVLCERKKNDIKMCFFLRLNHMKNILKQESSFNASGFFLVFVTFVFG